MFRGNWSRRMTSAREDRGVVVQDGSCDAAARQMRGANWVRMSSSTVLEGTNHRVMADGASNQ